MKVKRLLFTLGLLVALGSVGVLNAADKSLVYEGTFKGGTWAIYDDGELRITKKGEGAIPDYEGSQAPWRAYSEEVSWINLTGDKITRIGKDAFFRMDADSIVKDGNLNYLNVNSVGRDAFRNFYTPYLHLNGNGSTLPRYSLNCVPYVFLNDFETVNEYAMTGAHMVVLTSTEMLKAGALASVNLWHTDGTPSVFCTSINTPPNWKRLYEEDNVTLGQVLAAIIYPLWAFGSIATFGIGEIATQATDSKGRGMFGTLREMTHPEREYEYPFGDKPESGGEIIVVVPSGSLETYKNAYKDEHPETVGSDGTPYMCAYYTGEHSKKGKTAPCGRFVVGGLIKYGHCDMYGWWYVEGDNNETIHVGFNQAPAEFPYASQGLAVRFPWEKYQQNIKTCYIHGATKFTQKLSDVIGPNVQYVFIDEQLQEISSSTFQNCSKLEAIYKMPGRGIENGIHLKAPAQAFKGCTNLTTVSDIIFDEIGKGSFEGCTRLYGVNLSSKIMGMSYHEAGVIPENAFKGCSRFYDIDLKQVSEIGTSAFEGTSIKDVNLSRCSKLGNSAFKDCKELKRVDFGNYTKEMGQYAFKGCTALKDIFMGNTGAYGYNHIVAPADATTYQDITLSDITLHMDPGYYKPYGEDAIYGKMKADKSTWLPASGSLNYGCVSWELSGGTLTFTPIGYMGNYGTYSKDFYIPDYEKPSDQPWYHYREYIESIVLKSAVDSKGNTYGIRKIGKNAFAYPNTGESQITDIHIPRACTEIREAAFRNNDKLVSIYIDDVEQIGSFAFENCEVLHRIDLGGSFKKGGDYIFRNCPKLNTIELSADQPAEVTKYTFAEIGNEQSGNAPRRSPAKEKATDGQQNVTLKVSAGALNNYLVDQYWNKFNFDIYDVTHGQLKSAGKYGEGMWILYEDSTMVISANRDLTYQEASEVQKNTNFSEAVVTGTKVIIFQGKLESVGKGFSGMFKAWSHTSGFCNLERVSLPETVKRIYPSTFDGCRKLSEINITSVDTIDAFAFSNCGLTAVSLATAKSVGASAFSYCQNLSSVSLGDDTQLGNNVFTGCTALQAVDLGKGKLGSGMFVNCKNLSWASYSGSELPAATFSGCQNLSVLNLGTQLRKIGESAFTGCKMDTIYISTPNPSEMITKEEIIDWAYVDDDYNSYTHTIYDPFGYVTTDTRTGELRRKSVVDRTKIHLVVPETYASIYRKADFWKDMIINGKETELEFPITFDLGKKGSGIIDDKGNLKTVVYGEMSDKADDALAGWDNYISDKIEFDYNTRSVAQNAFSWMSPQQRKAAVAARVRRVSAGQNEEQQIEEALETPMTITFGTLMKTIEKGAFYNDLLDATTVFNCYAPKPITIKSGAFNWEVLNAGGKKPKLHIVNDPEVIEAWNTETYASVWKEHFDIVADLSAQKAPSQYTVTFVDGASNSDVPVVISEQVVDLGKSAVAPEAPEHIGYVFSGWDGDYTDVTEDRTIIANYTYTTHDVFFWVGQNVWEKQTVEHGGAALEPAKTPEMPGYVFDHWGWWSEKHDNVFKDFNVQAIWKQLVKATGITLDPDIKTINTNTAELQAGITFQITPNIVPVAAGDQQLIWSSNNTDVATVDQNGNVTITMATDVYNDVAIIKAVTTDGSELYAESVVDVTNEDNVMVPVYATSVRILGSKEITIYRGQTSDDPTKVRVVVEPSDYNQGIFAFLWNADMQDFEPGGNPDVINIADATDDEGNPLKGTFDIYAPFYDPTLYPDWKPYDVNVFFRVQTGSDPENIKHDTLKVHVVQDIIFTENNAQNIPITYRVIDNDTKTCETYSSQDPETSAWTPFMPYEVSGDNGYVSIPTKAREYNVVRVNGECASENITTMEFDNGIQHIAGAPAVPMIKKVILPKSYKRLDNSIFANNDKLKDVYIYAKTAPKEPFAKSYGVGYTNAFDQIGEGHATLHVVKGCKAEYNVKPWTDWFETITDDLSATHVVTFVDFDGSQIDKQDVAYREAAVAPEVPFHDGRTFKAWDKAFDCITGDLTVTALYDVAKYTVTFVDWNGSKLQETQVEFGESVSAPADPSRNGYVFKGWDKKSDFITESITINAVYAKLYTVSFIDWNDVELSTESVEEGQSAHEPNVPIRAGYRFTGWDVDFYNVQSDLIVRAQYVQEAQGVEYVKQDAPAPAVRKVLINGQLYIFRGDMIFNVSGMRVK